MYYRQPRYFGSFKCLGNTCSDNCCYGWRIDWDAEEVNKLKNAENISPELKKLVDRSFIPNYDIKDKYQIQFDEHGKCPCLTDDGWCRVQRELGVEYMSQTCMNYPRMYIADLPVIFRFCNISCREVMVALINVEKSMDLVNFAVKEKKTANVIMSTEKDISEHPELKYRTELLEFFYELIGDKKNDVETNIILGALAAQSLTKLVEAGDYDNIPQALKDIKAQLHNGAQLRQIENIKPNYNMSFGFIGKILLNFTGTSVISFLNDSEGVPNLDRYNAARIILDDTFKDRPFYLRNIALNMLLELAVPFLFPDKTIFENYSLFAAAFACIKLNLAAITALEDKLTIKIAGREFHYLGSDRFIGLTSMLSREILQNKGRQMAIIALLNESGITSPAYLALLVK